MAPVESNTTRQIRRLHLLARLYNVQTDYHDIFGRRRQASPEALIPVLRVLGAPINDIEDAGDAARERRQSLWRRPIEPVVLAWDGAPLRCKLRLPSTPSERSIDYEIALENGESRKGALREELLGKADEKEVEGARYSILRLGLPDRLPYGYHRLTLAIGKSRYESLIVSSPLQAYTLPDKDFKKEWGVFLPLYALQSQTSWGAGDFSDLERLMEWTRELGGQIVSTLPILASFLDEPFDPSPYSPMTRLFWNEFYVDVTRTPELEHCAPAREILNSADFHRDLEGFRSSSTVDYRAQMALKRKVMESLARCLFGRESERRAALCRFLESHTEIEDYAQFRAMTEKQKKPWMQWPESNRNGVLKAGDYEETAKHYHLYAQWLAHEQLAALAEKARQVGPALYLDFPLGVHRDGYDVWRERSSFALAISGGAPPDDFFIKGQNWGFPPLHPEQLRNQGYRYYIASLRHHLKQARLLRIDHVMGLHRLFWIAAGLAPADGVYVRYPAEEFYAILSLESHKHGAVIVGENLGTVPPYINEAMIKHKIFGLSVAIFKINADPERPLEEFSRDSVTSLNTHDTAIFAGFWNGIDIDEQVKLGLLDEAAAAVDRDRREKVKEALVAFLKKQGLLEGDGSDLPGVLRACLFHLSASETQALLINLEDLWHEKLPQNVPGTWNERVNWQRKARYSFEEFSQMADLCDMLKTIGKIRKETMAVQIKKTAQHKATLLTDDDVYLFNEGSHFRLYEKLGAHPMTVEGVEGTYFAVWAPNAQQLSVMGDFNGWNKTSHALQPRGTSGIWESFVPEARKGTLYKFHIASRYNGYRVDKADPFSLFNEVPPKRASIVWDLEYTWGDQPWMEGRRERNKLDQAIAIYELHVGSWRRVVGEGNRSLSYREMAPLLAEYVKQTGFTHVEFLPIMDHPFFGSWGYQITGYFAPSGNYGTPQDLMFLIDTLHQNGIGVILDWVPSHFPTDEHGLGFFDGTHLYEHADPQQGFHPEWASFIFNYGRKEVQSFLISNALFWLENYHIDGLRVDGVASMLYLDYARKEGEWVPNQHGGRENIAAIALLRRFNEEVYRSHPDVQTIAEESTDWSMVSKPSYLGGLGFGFKWDMGWMHDTLLYMSKEAIHRKYHHNNLTFRMLYAFHENFILPLSHDEVVYGKGSLLAKMPGDDWQKFANLRLLFAYMYAQPAKKLLFMGGEFGQWREWSHDGSLQWELLESPPHSGIQKWVSDLNRLYRNEPALHELDCEPGGFEWIDCNDADSSVLSFIRKGKSTDNLILVACNFTPVVRQEYRVGAPRAGFWKELLNSDANKYGGSGQGNAGGTMATHASAQGRPYSLTITLPPLGAIFFKNEAPG